MIKQTIKKIDLIFNNFLDSLQLIASLSLGFLLSLVIIQIFLRYFFNSPIYWFEELEAVLFVWINSIAIAIVYKKKGHPVIMFFLSKQSIKIKNLMGIFLNLLTGFCAIVMCRASINLFKLQNQLLATGGLPFNRAYYYALPTFVFSLLLLIISIYFILNLILSIKGER